MPLLTFQNGISWSFYLKTAFKIIFKSMSSVKYWLFILTAFTAYLNLEKTSLQPSPISSVTDRSCLSMNTYWTSLSFVWEELTEYSFISYHQMAFGHHSTQKSFSGALLRSGRQGCLRQLYEAEAELLNLGACAVPLAFHLPPKEPALPTCCCNSIHQHS